MKSTAPQVLKGFRDYLPSEQFARKKIIAKISESYERFGFMPMDTPSLESFDLFRDKIGEDEKLMYKFTDLGGREVALRYDLTVPLARLIAGNPELPKPFKRYIIGNSWRAENTQKGRFREFTQCDIDIIGTDSLVADAEVIAAMDCAYKALDIPEVGVRFNNRKLVDQTLTELNVPQKKITPFMRLLDKLDKIGEEKVIAGLKEEGLPENLLETYKKLMAANGQEFESQMKNLLSGMGVSGMEFDPQLMRGLDYYTGIVFEFTLKKKPEFGSVGGGGRYDNLIGNITGKSMPAVGGSIGLDRMFAALQELGAIAPQSAAEVLVMNLDESLTADYLNLTTNLRNAGLDCEFYYETAKVDKQFKYAESKNIQVAVIYGEREAKERKVNIKELKTKEQKTVDLDDVVTEIKSILW